MTDDPARQAALAAAKARLSAAAQACLESRPGAAKEADQAAAEVAALLAIERVDTEAASTSTDLHPTDGKQVRDEHNDEQQKGNQT